MTDRTGQVWWARHDSIVADFEPCVVLRRKAWASSNLNGVVGWVMRPLERLADPAWEFGHFESQFARVEAGCDDAWVGRRIA